MGSDSGFDDDAAVRAQFEDAFEDAYALKKQLLELRDSEDDASRRQVAAAFLEALVRPVDCDACSFADAAFSTGGPRPNT